MLFDLSNTACLSPRTRTEGDEHSCAEEIVHIVLCVNARSLAFEIASLSELTLVFKGEAFEV